jgi:SAM-dependent methyltransferase
MIDSDAYYRTNADSFFDRTVGVDAESLYAMFLPRIPSGGTILDAGCGSGRDALAFTKKGFNVTAVDASPELVEKAKLHTGLDVRLMRFEEIEFNNQFDGIWACASLLHVSRADTPAVFERFIRALKPEAVWYVSYKYGTGDIQRNGRLFSNHTEKSLEQLVRGFSELEIIDMSCNTDVRTKRQEDRWLNAILSKR